MSAVRRFMSQNSGYNPIVFKVDTSLGDGLPQMKVTMRAGYNGSGEYSVNDGDWVYYSVLSINQPLTIPLPANSISTIKIRNRKGSLSFNYSESDKEKIIELMQFGDFIVGEYTFINCSNLVIKATDTPKLSESLYRAFFGIKGIDSGVLNRWEFSKITSFEDTFYTMSESITDDLNIYAPLAISFYQTFRSIGGAGDFFTNEIRIDAPQVTYCANMFRDTKLKNKIVLDAPNNTSLYYAFANNVANECDLSEVDVRNVTENTYWIGSSLATNHADQMLVNWDSLPFMQSGVEWHLRGTQVTSIGKTAIDSMELKWGCTFSNYTVL